jgi:diaminopimelate epimerase
MGLKFTKMHGLGNDFMVVEAVTQKVDLDAQQVKAWSNRHFGIGFDQLLLVESTDSPGVDFRYRIFNADGSEVEQCGNGARCFAKFVYDKGLTDKTEITVETASGVIVLYVEADGRIRVNMGPPNFLPQSLPLTSPVEQAVYDLELDGEVIEVGAVSMGNPHAVLRVTDIGKAPVEKLGPQLESHQAFPQRVNVGFAERIDDQHIKLRVYERGAAETLACGTGACAAMVVFRNWNEVADEVTVSLPGGELQIAWNGDRRSPVWMTGPAVTVLEGELADVQSD